jgi:hypothetical protein
VRREPAAIPELLDHPRVFEALYGRPGIASGRPEAVSPFLAFAVAVHRAAAELTSMSYLPERSGLRQRVPVFDAPRLSAFLDSRSRRLFLAELLGSFTRVASGRYRVHTAHGWRLGPLQRVHRRRAAAVHLVSRSRIMTATCMPWC